MEVHQILVPVDFSNESRRALDQAIEFAKAFGAEIRLLHCYVLDLAAVGPTYGIATPTNYIFELHEAAAKRLTEWRSRVRAEGLNAEQTVSAQSPFVEIPALADEIRADLIVMGTRGLSGLKHVLLGSVAERTIRSAKCPVLVVKSDPVR
jgi:nucleotide-binding universal stress UspA family protein